MISGSSIVLNCKLGVCLILFHFMFSSAGMSIVCKDELWFSNVKFLIYLWFSNVKFLICFHTMITCSIFWMFIMGLELESLFSRFTAEALCMRYWVLNSLAFVLLLRSWDLAMLSFRLTSTKVSYLWGMLEMRCKILFSF